MASTGAPVQGSVTVTGLSSGLSYHWRARVRDASGQVSGWASFGGNAETSRDVAVDTAAPSGAVTIDGGAAWSDTPTVSLKLTCSDTQSGCGAMQLSNDNVTFTPPEPFAATRTWTLAGGDATKTVYVRYLDTGRQRLEEFPGHDRHGHRGPRRRGITATPNPFSPQVGQTTTIRIPVSDKLSASCSLKIRILDAAGGLVKSMAPDGRVSASGRHDVGGLGRAQRGRAAGAGRDLHDRGNSHGPCGQRRGGRPGHCRGAVAAAIRPSLAGVAPTPAGFGRNLTCRLGR